jgi:hypothetical protein
MLAHNNVLCWCVLSYGSAGLLRPFDCWSSEGSINAAIILFGTMMNIVIAIRVGLNWLDLARTHHILVGNVVVFLKMRGVGGLGGNRQIARG